MTRSKSIIGTLVLCALAVCAFGANSAFAAGEGLTAVQCEEVGPGHNFESSHCETNGKTGNFETVPFALNTSVSVEGTGVPTVALNNQSAILHGTLGLSEVTITCEKARTTGQVTNVTPGAEMQIHGTNAVTFYTVCEAHLKSKTSAEEACVVEGITGTPGKGAITTVGLTSTSGPEHKITFTSSELNELITEFKVIKEAATTGIACNLPNTTVHVNGSVIGKANTEIHSHITFSGEGALKANNVAATYTGTNIGHTTSPNTDKTVGATTFLN